jgi:hypothetical protein
MTTESPLSDVVRNYVDLASSLLERWSDHASKVAARLDSRDYDTKRAAEDLGTCASLATETGFLLASEAFEAAAILAGCGYDRNIVDSQTFEAPAGATLSLAGPLTRPPGIDQLPESVITIRPDQLESNETEFSLRADATGHRGGTYLGMVKASVGAGAPVMVTVWIVVP